MPVVTAAGATTVEGDRGHGGGHGAGLLLKLGCRGRG